MLWQIYGKGKVFCRLRDFKTELADSQQLQELIQM
jgi:hypothetical protein